MAHGWNSYYQNPSPLSTDPAILSCTPESEGSNTQHIENCIALNDFCGTATSHEVPETNANYNSSISSTGNAGSDCVYGKYYGEMPWQTDGDQTIKDYLPKCGNNISDFATDGLPSAESFSYATDLEGLKQDCGMLPTPFLEDYSDVSSCSDADGETRPSCKFMSSASVVKSTTSVITKQDSSTWDFTSTRNMDFSTDSLCPNMSSEIVSGLTNDEAKENETELSKFKLETPVHDDFSASETVTKSGSETVGGIDDYQHWEQMEVVQTQHAQEKDSGLLLTTNVNLTYVPEKTSSKNEQITTTPSNMFNNEQDDVDTKDEIEDLKKGDLGSLETETFDEQEILTTDCQDKNSETECQDASQSSDSPVISTSQDAIYELAKDSCQLAEYQPFKTIPLENVCSSPAISEDYIGDTSDKNEQCILDGQVTDGNPCQEKELSKTAEKTNTTSSNLDCGSPTSTTDCIIASNNNHQSDGLDPCLEKEWSCPGDKISTASDCCSDSALAGTDGSIFIETKDDELRADKHSKTYLEAESPFIEVPFCPENEPASLAGNEKLTNDTPSTDLDLSSPARTGDSLSVDANKLSEQSISHNLASGLQLDNVNTDKYPCLQKEAENSPSPDQSLYPSPEKTNSSPDQQSLHQSSMIVKLENSSARESFEEFDTASNEDSGLDVLYSKPLSEDDSSSEMHETVLDPTILNCDGIKHSEGRGAHLKSSMELMKEFHPVVILKTSQPAKEMSEGYCCTDCYHTTQNADDLIEHHHSHHSVHSFQFCSTCNVYLMNNDGAEKHLCGVTNKGPQLSSGRVRMKDKQLGRYRCVKCKLRFSKLLHHIKHMRTHTGKTPFKCGGCGEYFSQNGCLTRHQRIPGRCKGKKTQKDENSSDSDSDSASDSDSDISDIQVPQMEPAPINLGECSVKLNDISKTHLCSICGSFFLTATQAQEHSCKQKIVALSPTQPDAIEEKSFKVEHEAKEKYQCPLCPRLFKYSYNRCRHLRDCVRQATYGGKNKIGNKYRCPLCQALFTVPSNRYRHIKCICLKQYISQLSKGTTKPTQKDEQTNLMKQSPKKDSPNEQKPKSNDPNNPPPITIKSFRSIPRHKCNLCPAVFCHPSGKYRHMKKHKTFELTGKIVKYRNSVLSVMPPPTNLTKCTEAEESMDNVTEGEESTSLSCHFCGKDFETSEAVKQHEYSHRGEKPYRCLECGKGFKRHSYLISHKIIHQRRIQCTVCRKILPTVGELLQHRRSHSKRGMLQCPDCPQQFKYPVYLLRHLSTHKKKQKPPQPEESSPVIPQKTIDSEEEHSGSMQWECSLCKEVFDDSQILRKHCLTHISGSSRCQCPFCEQNFTSRRYLLRHMLKHTGDKSYSCTNCGKQFYRDLYLKLHREKCLSAQMTNFVTVPQLIQCDTKINKKRPYMCSFCPRSFCKKSRLKNHHIAHKKQSLLLCTKCGQYFGNQKLSQHQRNCVQTSDDSVSSSAVDEVDEASPSQTSLIVPKMPLQSKSKISHFKCTYCPQKFRFRSTYFRHLVTHTGLQPYPCIHCGHRYPSKSMCLQHQSLCDVIIKEKLSDDTRDEETILPIMPALEEVSQVSAGVGKDEYKCKFCTKTFVKARSLRRHILTHNEVKPYRCKACDSCFSRYDHLKVHQNHCKGKRQRLEVCIPKISFDDVGTGWQSKFGIDPVAKQQTFECTECERSFPSDSKLNRHNTMFHTVKLFKCTQCGMSFAHEKSLRMHKKTKCRKVSNVTNEINQPKETVANTTPDNGSDNLQRFQPSFNQKFKYLCNYCPRSFRNSWQLKVHTRLHTGEKPYACNYCGEKFIRNDYVQRHLTKCTKAQLQNSILCDKCGGFFPQAIVEDHRKQCSIKASPSKPTVSQTHLTLSKSQPKGFSCAYCTSHFLLFSQLQEHFLNTHTSEAMVEPVSSVPLQDHLSRIPNIKEEPLDDSYNDRLSDGANLTYKLTLDGESSKSFSCTECKMSFASKAGLVGHQRVHTNEPPFICKTCKKGFWNKSLLRNHYRKCRFGKASEQKDTLPLESPLKAKIDFALSDSDDTGVVQADLSSADDSAEEHLENPKENQASNVESSCEEKKAVQYQCSECDMSFTDGLLLISHLEDHGREEETKKRNTCPKCNRVCSSQGKLEKHMKLHGIDKKISCPDCSNMFYTKAELEIHRTCHDPNRPYACKLCNQRFWTRPSLCNHYGEEHPNDIFTCRFCKKIYTLKKSLSRHYKKWHQKEQKDLEYAAQERSNLGIQSSGHTSKNDAGLEKKGDDTEDSDSDSAPYFPCHVCGKTFPTSETLEDHQRCHLGEKPHECGECGKCFYQASQLLQHQRMHNSEFQCQACGKGFVSLFALRKHKHTHGKSRPYRCSKCHLSFPGPSSLAEHLSTHSEENFPCDICDHVFPSKSSRAEHRKSHSQLKSGDSAPPEGHEKSASHSENSEVFLKKFKYRCGVCYDRFRDPEELSEHGCMADKERPYLCSDCNKYFLHASHLKKHRNVHHQSRSCSEYLCNYCNNSFSSSEHFLSHLKNHNADATANFKHNTKDKTFNCPVCHQCFASVAELIHHFPMHPGNTFGCKLCKITFSSERSLKDHERCHHTAATEVKCGDCNQSFLGNEGFRQHICVHRHVVKKIQQSNSSGKACPANDHPMYGDEEDVDVTGEELYICPHCSMEFYSKSSLLEHQNKQHPNEKPFKCVECGKTFASKKYLGEHMRRHRQKWATQTASQSVRNQLNCTHCRTKFDTAQDLTIHMRLHAEKEVGDYRCDMCYKSFRQLSLLKHHQESHVGQVVYECTECEKAFAFPHLLEEHQQTHAGSSA